MTFGIFQSVATRVLCSREYKVLAKFDFNPI